MENAAFCFFGGCAIVNGGRARIRHESGKLGQGLSTHGLWISTPTPCAGASSANHHPWYLMVARANGDIPGDRRIPGKSSTLREKGSAGRPVVNGVLVASNGRAGTFGMPQRTGHQYHSPVGSCRRSNGPGGPRLAIRSPWNATKCNKMQHFTACCRASESRHGIAGRLTNSLL